MYSTRTRVIYTALTVLLAGSACLFSPDKGEDPPESGYYTPADSAWKVLHNFQLAYETQNIDAYLDCLHEEFEFILLEVDWDDYDGDGIIDQPGVATSKSSSPPACSTALKPRLSNSRSTEPESPSGTGIPH